MQQFPMGTIPAKTSLYCINMRNCEVVLIYKTETCHRLLLACVSTPFQGSMGVYPLLLLLHVAFVALSTAQTLPDPSGKAIFWHTKALVSAVTFPWLEKQTNYP